MITTQPVLPEGEKTGEFSFFEALTLDFKEPQLEIKDLSPPTGAPTTAVPKPHVPEKSSLQRVKTANNNSTPNRVKIDPTAKMAPPKAQTQCLELCHKTTSSIDLISIRILEYLTTNKQLTYGFEPLAHEFLDTCQILFSIEAGLGECNRTGQRLPQEMITELGNKFRVTQADFSILNQMLAKLIAPSNRIARGWGKLFGDTDIKKISTALAKTRESLRMSSLVFQWSLGEEKIEKEKGIGYTGLSAALDRMDDRAGKSRAREENAPVNLGQSQPQPQASSAHTFPSPPQQHTSGFPFGATDQATLQHQQQHAPWGARDSSMNHDVRAHAHELQVPLIPQSLSPPLSPNSRHHSSTTMAHTNSTDSYEWNNHYNAAIDDALSMTNITEPDSIDEELAALDLDPTKVVRVTPEPASMPRQHARISAEGDSTNMKAALISAIRARNHKLVEQLLHRGVPANTGPMMHALREAILARDEDSVRLLLVFGAEPNHPDRDGVTPLFAAVEKSFLAAVTLLLKYGADPNLAAGPEFESPLAIAAMANMVGITHILLTYNGDVNHTTANGTPLLTCAIKKKTPKKFIDLLLEYGASPNIKSKEGKTALFEAITLGRADIVTSLLDHGADPNLPGPKHMLWPSAFQPACLQLLLSHGADSKKTPGIMELAASLNNVESVHILLKAGVNPNTRKDGTYTPLCTAIRDDRHELVKLLLSSGADPNVMASEYPAFKCITHNKLHFLPALVAAGANLNSPKGILETAVSVNNMEGLNWLLDQGINPNDKTPKGLSPLTTAIRENRTEMVDVLLLRGADPHVRGQDWPLCMAVHNPPILKRLLAIVSEPQAFKGIMEMAVHANQIESVKMLLAAGVSVEDKNGGVFSPLTTAIREDRRQIVHYLVTEAGADVNAPGEHLPIVKALRRYHGEGDTDIMEFLLQHGADPNKLYRGWNGIMQAVENGDPDILRLLSREAGVDLGTRDELGRTVVEIAASRGWDEAVQILMEGDLGLRM